MPNFLDQLRDTLQGEVREFRTETFPSFRNKVAEALLQPGGKESHPSHKEYFHEGGNYALTKKLGEAGLPPWLAANASDLAYLGNETFTGALAKMAGKPFFSDYGFRWGDVAINRRGQDRARHELEAQDALQSALRRERGVVPDGVFGGRL